MAGSGSMKVDVDVRDWFLAAGLLLQESLLARAFIVQFGFSVFVAVTSLPNETTTTL